jgi:excinuclease ABC subunit C
VVTDKILRLGGFCFDKNMREPITNKISKLPLKPGVYIFKNSAGVIIYIGKAVRLRHRVQQYFSKRMRDNKTLALVNDITDLEWIQTETELDALILEAELIKRHRPRYNVLLRDDKSNIYIKITLYKKVPDVTLVRLTDDDQAVYFGPYYNTYPIRQALRYLRRIFPYFIRPYSAKNRSSLYRQIGLEPDVSTPEGLQNYHSDLKQLVRFLGGGRLKVAADLEKVMRRAAQQQDFETAKLYRDKLRQLRSLQQKIYLQEYGIDSVARDPGIRAVKQLFGLKAEPYRIEGFDVSHLSGTNVVASMTVFINGLPSRPDYRRFKMRVDQNNDVIAMGEVLSRRFKSANVTKWGEPDLILIDGGWLQLATAVKQLSVLNKTNIPVFALTEKSEEIVISRTKSNITLVNDVISRYLNEDYLAIKLPKNHPALRLFQRLRDEAHRFAISYQTDLKRKRQLHGSLDDIKGIGLVTRTKLQRHFGSVAKVSRADLSELTTVIGAHKAKLIWRAFHNSSSQLSQ